MSKRKPPNVTLSRGMVLLQMSLSNRSEDSELKQSSQTHDLHPINYIHATPSDDINVSQIPVNHINNNLQNSSKIPALPFKNSNPSQSDQFKSIEHSSLPIIEKQQRPISPVVEILQNYGVIPNVDKALRSECVIGEQDCAEEIDIDNLFENLIDLENCNLESNKNNCSTVRCSDEDAMKATMSKRKPPNVTLSRGMVLLQMSLSNRSEDSEIKQSSQTHDLHPINYIHATPSDDKNVSQIPVDHINNNLQNSSKIPALPFKNSNPSQSDQFRGIKHSSPPIIEKPQRPISPVVEILQNHGVIPNVDKALTSECIIGEQDCAEEIDIDNLFENLITLENCNLESNKNNCSTVRCSDEDVVRPNSPENDLDDEVRDPD
ncbi:hypothetical protein LOTGIDRAFT_173661 [Lottia gigantea]|uniref:Uncharacterized protein n=1 Tax=Lottia gigantea TaxID=225164 RepID=V4A6U3_LOTGI|nr:hypothetical protein LOTGIDRAFT_173661 [Lottia gigantea]ESO99653.1 hypothetical protein LOTGIDRAFT_173661 [Lottia gigantea]